MYYKLYPHKERHCFGLKFSIPRAFNEFIGLICGNRLYFRYLLDPSYISDSISNHLMLRAEGFCWRILVEVIKQGAGPTNLHF